VVDEAVPIDAHFACESMSAAEYRKGLCPNELLQPNMMEDTVKRTPLIAIALLIATNVAFAQGKHPADIRAIDAAMQTTKQRGG
jgi:hypothetical protein